mmetsp:Transcript_10569/g.24232  ORF Transcript_10569/g.24232 Transcript_10569/m.24232 type:complete len:204 (-) Transcript_10569:233-844(-)
MPGAVEAHRPTGHPPALQLCCALGECCAELTAREPQSDGMAAIFPRIASAPNVLLREGELVVLVLARRVERADVVEASTLSGAARIVEGGALELHRRDRMACAVLPIDSNVNTGRRLPNRDAQWRRAGQPHLRLLHHTASTPIELEPLVRHLVSGCGLCSCEQARGGVGGGGAAPATPAAQSDNAHAHERQSDGEYECNRAVR